MEHEDADWLRRALDRRLEAVETRFHRDLYGRIDWNDRLIGIRGPRGAGKTTMLLQRVKEAFPDRDKVLFASVENIWFANHPLEEAVEWHWTHGGTHVFLDEIHRLPDWQARVKALYDDFPGLSFVYTGSSMLHIDHARGDLSRRQRLWELPVLSFREFLELEGFTDIAPVPLETLLADHRALAEKVCAGRRILPLFERYLRSGCYPFYREAGSGYHDRLRETVDLALENDWPAVDGVSVPTVRKVRTMLAVLAERVPQTPNLAELWRELETDRNQGMKMLDALRRAGLLRLLSARTKDLKHLSRPDKIYLGDTNLMFALVPEPDVGTARETFLLAQLSRSHAVSYPPRGDFLVDGKRLFEVGGRGKDFSQIADVPDSFLAVDGIETGSRNRIPLWTFGLIE